MVKDKVIRSILKELSEEYGVSVKELEEIYESQWEFIAETAADIDFDEIEEEAFGDLKTNFNIPSIGKLYTNFNKVKNVRESSKNAKEGGDSTGSTV